MAKSARGTNIAVVDTVAEINALPTDVPFALCIEAGNECFYYHNGVDWIVAVGRLSAADAAMLASKEDELVSGTTIKTINGSSVLGSGNLVVGGGSGLSMGQVLTANAAMP